QVPEDSEQALDLVRGEASRRLVEQQDPGVAEQELHDLHALSFADGELPHERVGIGREPVAVRRVADATRDGSPIQHGAEVRQEERDVVGHGQRGHLHELLEDHADAMASRVVRRGDRDRGAVEADLAGVGAREAVQDLHQRALAGAVLADHGVHFTRMEVEVDAVVGDDAGEGFRDAAQGEQRRCVHRPGYYNGAAMTAMNVGAANREALERLCRARPAWTAVRPARAAIGLSGRTLLHAGPPIEWKRMCWPMRGAVRAAALFEGWVRSAEEADALAAAGEITFVPCASHGAVGPMAGIISPETPVLVVEDRVNGTSACSFIADGPWGHQLRFGAHGPETLAGLAWVRDVVAPAF